MAVRLGQQREAARRKGERAIGVGEGGNLLLLQEDYLRMMVRECT